eukprot:TRINITY_DN2098_c1_g1_i11.p1 TRINITY_DN2098_c1_g1~~TRINITY_DN2098_c1_g1_i11.p1  ORF type:complete len:169 (+),score=27.83 TRINITY_DN2098_c1_g1_i11:355-861(+)
MTMPCIEGEEDFSAKIFNREFDKMVPGKIRSYSRNGTDLTIHYDDFKHPTIRRVTYYSPTKQRGVNSFEEISPSIQQIVFSNGFDEPIDNNLSNAITHIHFGEQFNSPILALPLGLVELTFHKQRWFNHPITPTLQRSPFPNHLIIKLPLFHPSLPTLFLVDPILFII